MGTKGVEAKTCLANVKKAESQTETEPDSADGQGLAASCGHPGARLACPTCPF